MSMNLNAATKKGVVRLWQTPTDISYTILSVTDGEVKGVKATDALVKYMEWVKRSTDGQRNSAKELQDVKQRVDEHLEYIHGFLDDKTLKVWVM